MCIPNMIVWSGAIIMIWWSCFFTLFFSFNIYKELKGERQICFFSFASFSCNLDYTQFWPWCPSDWNRNCLLGVYDMSGCTIKIRLGLVLFFDGFIEILFNRTLKYQKHFSWIWFNNLQTVCLSVTYSIFAGRNKIFSHPEFCNFVKNIFTSCNFIFNFTGGDSLWTYCDPYVLHPQICS